MASSSLSEFLGLFPLCSSPHGHKVVALGLTVKPQFKPGKKEEGVKVDSSNFNLFFFGQNWVKLLL